MFTFDSAARQLKGLFKGADDLFVKLRVLRQLPVAYTRDVRHHSVLGLCQGVLANLHC
jgi:hypothetical protein